LSAEQANYGSLVFFHPHLEADDLVALLVKYLRKECASNYNFNENVFIMANDRDYLQLCNAKTHLYDITYTPIDSIVLGNILTAEDFLIKKILMGDIADNILSCYISKEFLEKHNISITSRPHLKCGSELITKLLNSASAKLELYEILNSCRALLASIPEPEYNDDDITTESSPTSSVNNHGGESLPANHIVLPNHESANYFKDNQFLYNSRVIDFENIPKRLVNEAIELYDNVFKNDNCTTLNPVIL
jgi:hypothetical protein